MTPAEMIGILGKPGIQTTEKLEYSFSVQKKMSEKELKDLQKYHTEMTDKEFHQNYDYYNLGMGFTAKFVDSKLTYLGVTRVESF
jgi:hypothetical protein